MAVEIRAYEHKYAKDAASVWNRVVTDGFAFPQTKPFTVDEADAFFSSQDFTGLAVDTLSDRALGVYILHPNNVGRCGHICNTSYAVDADARGKGIGEMLVRHSTVKAKEVGYRILQLNAVVATNTAALALYKKVGFTAMTTIPGGFLLDSGDYVDIIPHFFVLK